MNKIARCLIKLMQSQSLFLAMLYFKKRKKNIERPSRSHITYWKKKNSFIKFLIILGWNVSKKNWIYRKKILYLTFIDFWRQPSFNEKIFSFHISFDKNKFKNKYARKNLSQNPEIQNNGIAESRNDKVFLVRCR